MTVVPSTFVLASSRPTDRWRLPAPAAFYLQASIITVFLMASSAPTPLYALYQGEWGFSAITTTVVFGVYALAVLIALLIVGKLSDHVGRRPVLLVAIVTQAAAMIVFATATGTPALMVARVVQGLATGAAAGAVGAGMLDLDKARGTIANAVAPLIGTATGGVLAGILVQFLPAPTRLVYLVLLGVFVVQFAGVALMAESSSRRPGALASLKPEFTLPAAVRRPLLRAVPALIAIWALAGFYGSLGPSLTRHVVGSTSAILGGTALFVLAGSGALTVLALRRATPRFVTVFGTSALIVGVGLTLLSVTASSSVGFFVGGIVAGMGFGASFQGVIRSIVPLAAPHERAGVLSILYVVSYLAMGLPAVIAGELVVHEGSLLTTARQYGLAVMTLALLALIGASRRPAPSPLPGPPPPPLSPVDHELKCTLDGVSRG